MNETIRTILDRKSVRSYSDRPIDRETVDLIIQCAMRAPTAGAMMLYTIIEVQDRAIKDALAESCDHQPFIAKAPLVLLFFADYTRWADLYETSGVAEFCQREGKRLRYPSEGDLMLACSDALIAAQTAVIAAESLGIGSCYIGDVMEQYEFHRDLLDLPEYVFPIAMLCFGYPTEAAIRRKMVGRFPQDVVHHVDRYSRLQGDDLVRIYSDMEPRGYVGEAQNIGQHNYARKFGADFSFEMTRSARAAIAAWTKRQRALEASEEV